MKKSLAEAYPEILKKWDYQKNNKRPEEVGFNSSNKFWFICENGHSYYRNANIAVKSPCPDCKARAKSIGNKEYIMKFWDHDKNTDLDPYSIYEYQSIKAHWKCQKCGYKWYSTVNTRKLGLCPCCDVGTAINPGYNDVLTVVPCLAEDFIQSDNVNVDLTKIGVGNKKVLVNWTCHICGYKWPSTVFSRTKGHNGQNKINKCPVCGKAKRSITFDLQYPELAKKWNSDLNGFEMNMLTGTDWSKSFYWNCEDHGPFLQQLSAMVRAIDSKTKGCPFCANRKCTENNSLKLNYPLLFKEVAIENLMINEQTDVNRNSFKKIYWKCTKCGQTYSSPVFQKTDSYERGIASCPRCKGYSKNTTHFI